MFGSAVRGLAFGGGVGEDCEESIYLSLWEFSER